jgi:hypothetical protein
MGIDSVQQELRYQQRANTLFRLALSSTPNITPEQKQTVINIINTPPALPSSYTNIPADSPQLPAQIPVDIIQPIQAQADKILQLHPELAKSTHNIFDLDNVTENTLFWLTLLLLGQKDPKAVRDVLVTMFTGISKPLEAYCRAGVANRITAWGSGRLLSLYMERLGMLTQPQATSFSDGLTILSGASIAEAFTSIVIPWKFTSEDTQFPDQVTLAESGAPIISSGGRTIKGTRTIGKSIDVRSKPAK